MGPRGPIETHKAHASGADAAPASPALVVSCHPIVALENWMTRSSAASTQFWMPNSITTAIQIMMGMGP